MKKRPIGQYFEKSGRAYYRLKTDDGRPSFPIALEPGPAAERRAKDIATLVDELRQHGKSDEIVSKLVERAALAPSPAFFDGIRILVREICDDEIEPLAGLSSATTSMSSSIAGSRTRSILCSRITFAG